MNFLTFKAAVAAQFERMQKHQMFRVDIEKQLLWDTYLASFRPEDNPIYRKRTEHDCACCRSFIKSVGDCVAVIDGQVVSIWDIDTISVEQGYDIVAFKMAVLVKSRPIANRFLSPEKTVGTDKNFEQLVGGTKTWNHFFAHIDKQFVEKKDNIPTKLGEQRSSRYVFHRSLRELTLDSVDTVLELIAQNSLYRGKEHKAALLEFRKLKVEFDKLSTEEQDLFTWTNKTFEAVYRIKNTSIGTLLDDLSTGIKLEVNYESF